MLARRIVASAAVPASRRSGVALCFTSCAKAIVAPIPHSLGEVTLAVAEPNELRRIAAFLLFAADELATMGTDFDHVHLRDWDDGWSEPHTDFIVARVPHRGDLHRS
jgi:hypothetical protein